MMMILAIVLPLLGLAWPRRAAVPAALGFVALCLAGGTALDMPWLGGIHFSLAMGGFGAALALLASLSTAVVVAVAPEQRRRLLLVLGAAAVGLFLARDLIVLYVFWELMLIPAYFLIGSGRAATQFLIYNVAGSLFMLLGFLALGQFAMPVTVPASGLVLLGLMLGFAAKAPLWPLHGWQADAYTAAPSDAAALMAGVQSKAGLFGFYMVAMPALSPAARPWLLAVGIIAVLYGAFAAIRQDQVRRLLAYSSVGHLGLMFLGLVSGTQLGLDGAIILAVAHGLYTVALFLMSDKFERISDLGGLAKAAPGMGAMFTFTGMAALGLPGLAGFPGELLILIGLWSVSPWLAAAAGLGVLLAAIYMLRAIQGIFHGPAREGPPLKVSWALAPIFLLILAIGLDPQLLWGVAHP
ncbi:MAG TPA: NADH-quinone oxidoreductase subunit M [Bacillota bacterium]|nr:NADH-quinone oxidoreductase subunit M [Bacillota bacterium]